MKRLGLLAAVTLLSLATAACAAPREIWRDRSRPSAERAAALVRAMTRDEKLAYIHGYFPPYQKPLPTLMSNSAGYVPGVPRLGIPALRESDASLGVANNIEQRKGDVATALPSSLAIAASFDPALARAGGAMIGAEARAKTFNVLLAGGVNLTRDAWNGRNFEYFGEDPLLSGIMAGASVAGVQSNHIVSTVKHYVLNAQETGRDTLNARIDWAALQESDLLAFRIAIEEGHPGSVMCAYNKVNGDYSCENRRLLTDVPRGEWRYPGFIMSDWGAVHSTEKAALAGLEQESGQELDSQVYFGAPLAKAVADGRVPEARFDEMVQRILTAVIATGLYDNPVPERPQRIDYRAHAAVAQRIAEAGMVLLKNDKGVLPLLRTARRIVLIGGHADVGVLSGGGSSQVRSVGGVPIETPRSGTVAAPWTRVTYHNSSPLRALRAAMPNARIDYLDGSDRPAAAAAARGADVAIVFATQWRTEAEDLGSLSLPDGQDALIESLARANPRTVVVLETGGAVLMPWLDQVPAVIEAWYPGQRGGEALARLLLGDVDFTGRLPLSFPASAAQLPRPVPADPARPIDYVEGADVGYRWYAAKHFTPLFSFGYGLSYAHFGYRDARFVGGATPSARVTVSNNGPRAGSTIVQFYLRRAGASSPRLAGWRQVTLAAGQSLAVAISADPRVLARHVGSRWSIPGGRYRAILATSATTPIASGEIVVAGVGK